MALFVAGSAEAGRTGSVLLDDLVAACRAVDDRWGDELVTAFEMLISQDRLLSGHAGPETTAGSPETTATRRLAIQVLGGLTISLDGGAIEMIGLRPLHRGLLATFCTFADRVVPIDQLLEWFWPVSETSRAQHSLQVGVSELRRALDVQVGDRQGDRAGSASRLRREGAGYLLRLSGADECDARQLERRVQSAKRARLRGDGLLAISELEVAVRLYRGDVVPEAGNPEWVQVERDRLRQVAVDAYEQLVIELATAGEHRRAVAAARAGLSHDRHRDGLWRQLVTSLLALDQPVAAAAAKRSYDQLLVGLRVLARVRT